MGSQKRRDSKNRVLRTGESVRADGKYQYKYIVNGKTKFVYSWRLEATDKVPAGKKPGLSLRELEKKIQRELESRVNQTNIRVLELVERYIATRTGVKIHTQVNYNFVVNLLKKEDFAQKKVVDVKTSDAKLFLIKLQSDGKGFSTIKTIRGVLRPAFQMAMDDDMIVKNPFNFQLVGVIVNDSITREAISPEQMQKFLTFVHDDNCYRKYYETVYILFHTSMRISEFCGLTIRDIDFEKHIINIDHQLQRGTDMKLFIEKTKTHAGTRKLPMSEEVERCFRAIIERRPRPEVDYMVDGYTGFLFLDKNSLPLVALHWEHHFSSMVGRYNRKFKDQMPNITPHVCRHTYCSNQARAGMNPKTLQYLMGHSDITVTLNTYTHLGLEDAIAELQRMEEVESARREQERISGPKEREEHVGQAG